MGCILICAGPAFAQKMIHSEQDVKRQSLTQSPPMSEPPLDLKGAVEKAVRNNNFIRKQREHVEQSRQEMSVTRTKIFPSINLVGTGGSYKNGTSNALFDGNIYNQYNIDLKLIQPLLVFGSLAAIRQADDQVKLSEFDVELAERDLVANVIKAFYKVMSNRRLVEILERTQKVVSDTLTTAQSRLRTGRGQLLDVLQVKTEMALLKPQIEDAHNQLESSGAVLATFLAEEGKYELQLKGSLRAVFLKDVQRRLNFKNARLPELEKVRMQREALNETRSVTEGTHLPHLELIGDYVRNSYTKGGLGSDYARSWSVILQLTIPLFSGFQSIYERRSLASQDRQLEYAGRDLENSLALSQVQSLKTLQSAGASLESAEEAASLADQSMAEARRNYRLATIDFLQFLTVEKSTLEADKSLNKIKQDNIEAFANYFVATGQPLNVLVEILGAGQ